MSERGEEKNYTTSTGIVALIILGLGLIWFLFFRGHDKWYKWLGFYYPNAGDLLNYKQSSELNSLEECREWVDVISGGRTDTGFDYECGKNCKLTDDYKYLLKNDPKKLTQYNLKPTYVCKQTLE
ncbi:MAG: hypothetical protein WAP74_01585 [Patescibacteria group bacterium]